MHSSSQDGVVQLLPEATRDIDRLNEQATQLERVSPAEMLAVAQQANQLAVAANYAKGIAVSLALIGQAHIRLGNLNEADKALAQAQACDVLDTALEAAICNGRGTVHFFLKIYDKAFSYYKQGLSLVKRTDDRQLEAKILNNIGLIYRDLKDYAKSLDWFQMSLQVQEDLEDSNSKSIPVGNIGLTYLEMGDLDNAELYSEQAILIAQEQNHLLLKSFALQHLGVIARKRGQPEQAIGYLNESLAIYRSTRELIHATQTLLEFYRLYFDQGDTEMSLHYLQQALAMAEEADSLADRLNVYLELARVYESVDDIRTALHYHKQYQATIAAMEQEKREQSLRALEVQIVADESFQEKETYRALSQELDRKAREVEEAYLTLQAIGDTGKSITATLDLEQIFDLVHRRLPDLMVTDVFGIGLYNRESNSLDYEYLMEAGQREDAFSISLESTQSFAVVCFKQRKGFLINSLPEDAPAYVRGVEFHGGPSMSALMLQPLLVEDDMIGVMTVQSHRDHVYNEHVLDVLGLLASYLSIAIQNARKTDQLKEEIRQRELAQQELQRLNRELDSLSNRDGLTNVANRRHFDQFLRHTWCAAVRRQLKVSLLMIDIDCFKEYNDCYGHLSGDEVIKKLAQALQKSVKRGTDLVARFGGDEFVVLLGDTDDGGATQVARTIQEAVFECGIMHAASLISAQVTVSIGVTTMMPSRETQSSDLVARGDSALYQAKQGGRNRVCVF